MNSTNLDGEILAEFYWEVRIRFKNDIIISEISLVGWVLPLNGSTKTNKRGVDNYR